MENITISCIYTVPEKKFFLSTLYMDLLENSLKNELVLTHLAHIKAKELEIYILTDGESPKSSVQKNSKTDKGNYLSFNFYLAYPKIQEENYQTNLVAFTEEFFWCLKYALENYQIDEVIEKCKQKILEQIQDTQEYSYVPSAQKIALQKSIRNIVADFESQKK